LKWSSSYFIGCCQSLIKAANQIVTGILNLLIIKISYNPAKCVFIDLTLEQLINEAMPVIPLYRFYVQR